MTPADRDQIALFALRVWNYKQGEVVSLMVHLGDRLGLYKAMAGAGPVSAAELAERTGLQDWIGSPGPSTQGGVSATTISGRRRHTTSSECSARGPAWPWSLDFDGFDVSQHANARARTMLAETDLSNARFHVAGAAELRAGAGYDFVLTLDCIHDMPRPAEAIAAIPPISTTRSRPRG